MFEQIIKNWNSLSNQKKFVIVVALIALFVTVIYFIIKLTEVPTEVPTSSPTSAPTSPKKGQALKSATSKFVIPKFLSSDDNGNLSLFDLDKHTTENYFSALSLSTPGNVTAVGNVTAGSGKQLCIGSTCINENQLKQLIRDDKDIEYKPSEYYEMTGSTLIFEHYQNVATLGWSLVKTIVPGNKALRIVQQAYKASWTANTTLDSDVAKMYTRYSLSDKTGIEKDVTKNGWTLWSDDIYINDWKISAKDGHLRYYYDNNQLFLVNKLTSDVWSKSTGYLDKSIKNIRSGLNGVIYHLKLVRSQTALSSTYQDTGLFTQLEGAATDLDTALKLEIG